MTDFMEHTLERVVNRLGSTVYGKYRGIVSEAGNQFIFDDDANEVKIVHSGGPEITISDSEIVMKVGGCELKIGTSDISLNNGLIKVGLAGVSLVNGAMAFGVPP